MYKKYVISYPYLLEAITQYHRVMKTHLKGIRAVRIEFFFILKVANIRCFILIAVEIFHNIIRK
jgi:hypothetical protein